MAIQFARIEIVGRSSGGNACCKGAYNARAIVKDNKTNITYNFKHKGDNVYHTVLLPEHADKRFSSVAEFMNEVEHCEKRKDSQLLKDIVLALPDDKELNLQDRINITHLLIEKRGWVKEGLGVQVDIHEPHDGEKNWHAHLLVTTRRFTEDGKSFGPKATDLNPQFGKVGSKAYAVPEAEQIHEELRDIINDYFKDMGLDKRVDAVSSLSQEHIGPVRMRSIMNQAIFRNEERREANIEQLKSSNDVLDRVTANKSVFSIEDIIREVKFIPDRDVREELINGALKNESLIALCENGKTNKLYTSKEIRAEEEKILRLSGYVANGENVITAKSNSGKGNSNNSLLSQINSSLNLTKEQTEATKYLLNNESGVRVLQGRAGTGKSHVLGKVCSISESMGINVIGIAPTHKARTELAKVGYEQNDTVKGMLFKLHNGRFLLPKNSLIVVDEAGMVANSDYQELMRVAATRKCNVILAGDSRQLSSVSRGGMFEVLADKFGSCEIANIQRQREDWGREVAMCFSRGDAQAGLAVLENMRRVYSDKDAASSMENLLHQWSSSLHYTQNKIILAVENKNVDALNAGARFYLKAAGYLDGDEISIGGREFMCGDRVLITKTDKSLGVTNGDIGTIQEATTNKFTLSIGDEENPKIVEFDPNKYNDFRHGYATTVFKAQGASINDVYVFHDGFAGMRNSYVSLSRHIEDIRLYTNNQSTPNMDALVTQMSLKLDKGSSLHYSTREEVENQEVKKRESGLFGNLINKAKSSIRTAIDKHLPKSEYYNYKEPSKESLKLKKVENQSVPNQNIEEITSENKIAVGENNQPRNYLHHDASRVSNLHLVQMHEDSNKFVTAYRSRAVNEVPIVPKPRHDAKAQVKPIIQDKYAYLQYASTEIHELDKLGVKIDKDAWLKDLKNVHEYKEIKAYAQNKLGIEAKKYIEPKFLKIEKERLNAGNFAQFLNVVAKEQSMFVDIKEKHRFTIREIDRINNDFKYSFATTHACDFGGDRWRKEAISLIGYAAKNNIVSEKKIRDNINSRSGDIGNIYGIVKSRCNDINEKKAETQKARQQEIEKQNQQQKDMNNDRGMGGMSL